jgi:hypothetical protein
MADRASASLMRPPACRFRPARIHRRASGRVTDLSVASVGLPATESTSVEAATRVWRIGRSHLVGRVASPIPSHSMPCDPIASLRDHLGPSLATGGSGADAADAPKTGCRGRNGRPLDGREDSGAVATGWTRPGITSQAFCCPRADAIYRVVQKSVRCHSISACGEE